MVQLRIGKRSKPFRATVSSPAIASRRADQNQGYRMRKQKYWANECENASATVLNRPNETKKCPKIERGTGPCFQWMTSGNSTQPGIHETKVVTIIQAGKA